MIFLFLLTNAFYFTKIIYGYNFDESSLMELLKLTESSIDDFGFTKVHRASSFLSQEEKRCALDETDEYLKSTLPSYPEFQKIYLECQIRYAGENSTCFATCIFYGIIQKEDYGIKFLRYIKSGGNLYYDDSQPYPHTSPDDLHNHENIFCFSNEYRSTLLNNIFACQLPSSVEVCVIDEEEIHCDSQLGNCNFDGNEVFVLSTGNKAHPLTCGSLKTLWSRPFKKSTKFHCILQRSKLLSDMARPLFRRCEICSDKEGKKKKIIIEHSKSLTKEEFASVSYSRVPIIFRNGAKFENMPVLNFSFIKEIYSGFDFKKRKGESCKFSAFSSPFVSLEDALSKIKDDTKWDLPWYLSWNICHPDILKRIRRAIPRPSFLPDDHPSSQNVPRILAGTPGDGVFYHIDYNHKPTMQAQLSGNKTWLLRPPPECQRDCSKWIKVRVYQGDIIIIQTNIWYHETFIDNGPLSIAYTVEYDLNTR